MYGEEYKLFSFLHLPISYPFQVQIFSLAFCTVCFRSSDFVYISVKDKLWKPQEQVIIDNSF
jgi:hypothetical protein